MARDRDRDEDFSDEPPRRRRDEEGGADTPRRRRRDDDDDYDDPPVKQLSGLDAMFANTNIVVLVLFSCCCNGIALILGIVGLATCTDAKAKSNALLVTILSGIIAFLAAVAQITQLIMNSK